MPVFRPRMPHTPFATPDTTVDTPRRQNRLREAHNATSPPHRCQCPELGQECPACVAYRRTPQGRERAASREAHASPHRHHIGVLLGTHRHPPQKSCAARQEAILAATGAWVRQTGRLPTTADLQSRALEVGISLRSVYKVYPRLGLLYAALLTHGLCTARQVEAARRAHRQALQDNARKSRRRKVVTG